MSFRTKFDLVYTIMNDEVTGLLTYIGDKSTIISYDGNLNQWNMTVVNDLDARGWSYSEMPSLVIGEHNWTINGDHGCSTQEYTTVLSLSSCKDNEFTCTNGLCIGMEKRCNNVIDCNDISGILKFNKNPNWHLIYFR